MNLLKKMSFLLFASLVMVSCGDDEVDPAGSVISGLDFTITATGSGNIVEVLPSAVGATSYSVDFGTEASDDVLTTVGPKVSYTYAATSASYDITVTASATGADNVIKTSTYAVVVEVSDIVGRWVFLHEAGALIVAENLDVIAAGSNWWSNDLSALNTRACLFDDVYEFKEDMSFLNILGEQTWLEDGWAANDETCGAPYAPFDGSATATWSHNTEDNTVSINGMGAFLGIATIQTGSVIDDPANAVESITYSGVTFSEDKNTMTLHIDYAAGVWQFKFAREGSVGASNPTTDTDGDGVSDLDDACPDVAGSEANGCNPSGIGADPSDDFEGNGNINWFEDSCGLDAAFANPDKSGANTSDTVLQYSDTGADYANIRFDLNEDLTDKFDLSTKNIFKVMVYVPTPTTAVTAPKQLELKIQDGSNGQPWTQQYGVAVAYEYDTWQELTFDFSSQAAETKYSRVVVQFNGEGNNEAVVAYIDNFTYGSN
jgi:hypothetical protein